MQSLWVTTCNLVTPCMVVDVMYGWWRHVWLVMPCMVGDVMYCGWRHVTVVDPGESRETRNRRRRESQPNKSTSSGCTRSEKYLSEVEGYSITLNSLNDSAPVWTDDTCVHLPPASGRTCLCVYGCFRRHKEWNIHHGRRLCAIRSSERVWSRHRHPVLWRPGGTWSLHGAQRLIQWWSNMTSRLNGVYCDIWWCGIHWQLFF